MAKKSTATPVKKDNVFDIINALFNNKAYIENMTKEMAKQNLFMILRRLAIKYPLETNVFNDNKVNAFDVVKFWSSYLYTGKNAPKWVYTSGAPKSKDKKSEITTADIKLYKKHYGINNKDFDDAMRFFPDDVVKEVKELKEFYDQLNKI